MYVTKPDINLKNLYKQLKDFRPETESMEKLHLLLKGKINVYKGWALIIIYAR